MLQPSLRGAGCAAGRVSLRRVLQSDHSWRRCQCGLVASAAVSRASRPSRTSRVLFRESSISPTTQGQLQRFSTSRGSQDKDFDPDQLSSFTSDVITDSLQTTSNFPPPSAPSSTVATPSTSSSNSDVPWYMRVDVPKHASLTLLDTPLPPIPSNVPSLVKPLLTFVAEDLGLVDLKLLDLRALDPPAALGPDLIMLFGSARSERHLHVSADRLVRWLRKYGINATADGLLGRNELKIKLRRKARRAKLLGNMASLEAASNGGQIDDGISTQWVCLHAGTVGRSRAEGQTTDSEGRTTGFGSLRSAGTTVVVQMFTETKRKQMDLETLWSKTLVRSVKKRTDAGEDVPEWDLAAAQAARDLIGSTKAGKIQATDDHTGDTREEDVFAM